jgi:hypothetical protein
MSPPIDVELQTINYLRFFKLERYPRPLLVSHFGKLSLHGSYLSVCGGSLVFCSTGEIFVDLDERIIASATSSYFCQLISDGYELAGGIGSQRPSENGDSNGGSREKDAIMFINPIDSSHTNSYKALYILFDLLIVESGYVALAWGFGMVGLQRDLIRMGAGTAVALAGFVAIAHGFWNSVH